MVLKAGATNTLAISPLTFLLSSVLKVVKPKVVLKAGAYVTLLRGEYKGDLAQVVRIIPAANQVRV